VPYHIRVCIDKEVRISYWYDINVKNNFIYDMKRIEKTTKPDLHILAFDIETTKLPMKFPDPKID
jgi:DNA polymerase epsilon subunit 1